MRQEKLLSDFLSGKPQSRTHWSKTYLSDPVLKKLARLVVWSQQRNSFTLSENGEAIDAWGTCIKLSNAGITLAHPMEMTAEETGAWQNYFLSRNLKQPFEQVWEPVQDGSTVRADRYDGCTIPLHALMNKEKHGLTMQGQSKLQLQGCKADLKLVEGRSDWVNNQFEISNFKFKTYNRQVNHIVAIFDKSTVEGRILKDDVSAAQWFRLFTPAQIMNFVKLAAENNAANVTALLLDYRNTNCPEIDPLAEFTLD